MVVTGVNFFDYLCLLFYIFTMLKIKLVKDFSILQFPDVQDVVWNMLKDSHNWGSYHNHNCPSEICLLCYAIVLWFNLANLIFDKYTPSVSMQCGGDEEAQGQPQAAHRPSRASYIVVRHQNTLI